MIALVTFWFCYDDTLARLTEMPGLGRVPFFMWFWLTAVCGVNELLRSAAREL